MSEASPLKLEDLPAGWTVPGHEILVIDRVSRTRQAVVYKARQSSTGRLMALKISLAVDVDDVGRFKREAELLQQLEHPNIGSFYGAGVLQSHPYMIMEWLEGESLSEVLSRKGTLTPEELSVVFSGVCDALQYAHSRDLIHRDIKPSNIFIERTGEGSKARLMDFGMAKPINTNLELTPAGFVLGSPAYMSPEQCTGQKLDCRSDVYSLSCVLYECLSGRKLFIGESNMDAMYKHLHEQPIPIAERPAFSKVILRGLEKSPDSRYQKVADLRRAWEREITKSRFLASLRAQSVLIIPVAVFVVVVVVFYLVGLYQKQ